MKNSIIFCLGWMTVATININSLLEEVGLSLVGFMSCKDLHNLATSSCDTNEMSKPYLDGRIHKIVETLKLGFSDLNPVYWERKMKIDFRYRKYEFYQEKLNEYRQQVIEGSVGVSFNNTDQLLNPENIKKIGNLLKIYSGIRPDRKAAAQKFYTLMLEVRNDLLQYQKP